MWWLLGVLLVLVLGVQGFYRGDVEGPPAPLSRTAALTTPFGTSRLPLRSSVEKLPTKRERIETHSPLREAVERRPTPYWRGPWWRLVPGTKQSDQSGRRLFCFIESWASYRRAPATFTADDVDPFACTHVVYAFATVDPVSSKIIPLDDEFDVVKGGYRSIVGLKRVNSNLKVLLSLSGRLSKMTSSASNRRTFILSAVKYLAENGFDGLDIHWEYPGAEDLGGRQTDKENLSKLIEELSGVLDSRGWLLTASVSPSRFRLEDGYDVPRIAPFLHFILLKSFDFHEERDSAANHPSPLVMSADEDPLSLYYNVDYSVRFWIKRGVRRSQLILGIPFFGRSYTLQDPKRWTPGSPVKSPGVEARFTQQPGFMAYYEVCSRIQSKKWKRHREASGASYMVNGDQWVGFEDQQSIRMKMDYLTKEKLGGVMVWSLDLDDFKGVCGPKYPLLNAVKSSFLPELPAMISPGVGVTVLATASNCSGEGYIGDNNDCSVYYRCQWSMKHTYICPHGLHYDPQLNLCNWPTLVTCPYQGKATLED